MTYPVLPIPSPLTSDWVAPAGVYSPKQVNVTGNVKVDLTQADIIGAGTGYLFKPLNGASVSVELGGVYNMAGIYLGLLGLGGRAYVEIVGGYTENVTSGVLYKSKDGGRLDAKIVGLEGYNMGAGIRTWGSAEFDSVNLHGGSDPSSGDPAALCALDLNDTSTIVDDQVVRVLNSSLSGFTSDGFQGDLIIVENTVRLAIVVGNRLSNASDALVDSKGNETVVVDNDLSGPVGVRMVTSHWGRVYSLGNRYTVPAGAYALQVTAGYGAMPTMPTIPGLISDGDTFDLSGGGKVMRATYACQGSTGFVRPTAGVGQIRNARGAGVDDPSNYLIAGGVCSTDGLRYYPQIIQGDE